MFHAKIGLLGERSKFYAVLVLHFYLDKVCVLNAPFNMTLPSALMSTESPFSEILPSRDLVIALEPICLLKFCEKHGINHINGNRKTH